MDLSYYIAVVITSLIPATSVILWFNGLIAAGALITVFAVLLFIFFIFPVIYRYSYSMQRNLLFLNFVSVPVDYKNPLKQNLLGTRNVYITTNDSVTIGIWHILPASLLPGLLLHNTAKGPATDEDYDEWLGRGDTVFLYMHGNSGNRGASHRVELYKVLQQNNYHVIAFDYRSYGDSSSVEATEEGVVSDTKAVYKWLKGKAKNSKIFFWGHSLGTGISSHALDDLESEGESILGLVLECPFNNMKDEIRSYPLAKVYRILPWFDYFFTDAMYENGLQFETDKHLLNVKTPILILHAEDDIVVPYKLGYKLYETIRDRRGEKQIIRFEKFGKELRHGHKLIYRDKRLSSLIQVFVNESMHYKED